MNKRITSLLLCFVMIFAMLATAVPAFAWSTETAEVELSVVPDKTQANPGDTITYTVNIGPVKRLQSVNFTLIIPDTLEYGVGKEVDGLKELLGADKAEYTDSTKTMVIGGGGSYTSESATPLMKFTCTVKSTTAVGSAVEVEIMDDWDIADDEWETYQNVKINSSASKVTITAAPKPATGISLNKSTLSLVAGGSETLTATVEPTDTTDTVTWSSDNTSVATVDSTGKVTAIAAGTAKITAKAGDKTATCDVTVDAAPCTHANKTIVPEKASTCTEKGWDEYQKCNECEKLFNMSDNEISGIPYRNLASHNYTKEEKKGVAQKAAATCKDEAVYYYSCSVCGAVEHDDAHTFKGDFKNSSNHVGGTRTEGAYEPDHKNQTPGSTGKTICNGCDAVLAAATEIQPGDHVAADVWSNNETNHWKVCKEVGCGVVIDGSKAAHSSTGNNVATCQKKAVCDVCKVQYGALAAHKKADSFSSDSTGHWYACTTSGCTEKLEFAAHTPDHKGHATEEYAIKCTVCNYVIEAQLGHTHNFNQQNTDGKFKATDATCTKPATYYYSCTCGEKGTETFEYGSALDHTEGTAWEKDENYHWHICTVAGCGVVIESSKAAHTPDKTGGATYDYPILCSECGYVMEAKLEDSDIRIEVPFKLTVAKTGEKDPSAETFKFALSDFGAPVEIKIVTETVATDGAKTYEGSFVFTVKKSELGNLSEGFVLSQVKGDAEGWTYDETAYRVVPASGDEESIGTFRFFKVDAEDGDNGSETVMFTNSYNAKADAPKPDGTTKPDDTSKKDTETSPKTGDNSMLTLWVALLFVSGAALTGTTLYSRKKRTYNR